MGSDANDKRTEDQSAPARPSGPAAGREAFVAVFPVSRALPVPPADEPFGRKWIAANTAIDDSKASAHHARIRRRGGRIYVEDLGSRNGTWVNGARIPVAEPVAIDDGTILRVGRTLAVYRRGLSGGDVPSPPLGALVGPFGLRGVETQLDIASARRPRTVLIEGETGTGKELLAREVSTRLGRISRYGTMNIAAVPASMFEAQLFGHLAGAFTGAHPRGSSGVFIENDGGSVLLDEIGELPLDLQPKLLRLLENREVWPVGGNRAQYVDVLILAASNRSLRVMVEEGRFRLDLLARLEEAVLRLPPLRERQEDILAIAQAWLQSRGAALDMREVEVEAVEHLLLAPWPANVRELRAKLNEIAAADRPGVLHAWAVEAVLGAVPASRGPITIERAREVLERRSGNVSAAARDLGINRPVLIRLLARHRRSPQS